MIKSFYKKSNRIKYFFNPALKIRSKAYGSEVLNEFLVWRKYFMKQWNHCEEHFLLSAQGSIDGNPVRMQTPNEPKPAQNVKVLATKSFLPVLYYKNLLLEASEDGAVSVNGKRGKSLGSELKAWAIMSLPERFGVENKLLVVGKPTGQAKMQLAVYDLTRDGVGQLITAVPLEYTLDKNSFLICFHRHVFLVHNSKLEYYYFDPDGNTLDSVSIGGDALSRERPYCQFVRPCIVADENGYVYWISDSSVCAFQIGSPKNLISFVGERGTELVRLQCYGNTVYYYGRLRQGYSCMAATVSDGEVQKAPYCTDSTCNLLLGKKGAAMQYIKLSYQTKKALVAFREGGTERLSVLFDKSAEQAFCLNGAFISGARYAGFNNDKTITAIE